MTYQYQQERPRNLVQLLADALDQFSKLFQTEIRLVRAEIDEKVGRLANGGVFLAAGGVAALAAVFLLLQAIVSWLAYAGLPERWGYLLVGVIVAGAAYAVIMKGINNLKTTTLVPDRTINQVRADLATVKEHVT